MYLETLQNFAIDHTHIVINVNFCYTLWKCTLRYFYSNWVFLTKGGKDCKGTKHPLKTYMTRC